ncbi:hypothetical protein EVAR_18147_1 [Eumeta japonica]|uniref:Uncharacterized protein n=1 Tax=Eumeta variegata TaxID=151549 RepID=A0A4C1UV84_EUMVA|nr:hypothetical protein EVAR_18147_1 [Eumeta japonica]
MVHVRARVADTRRQHARRGRCAVRACTNIYRAEVAVLQYGRTELDTKANQLFEEEKADHLLLLEVASDDDFG